MVSAISGGTGTFSTDMVLLQKADQILKAADSNNDAQLTTDEFTEAAVASGASASAAAELFNQLDQGGKGYLTKQDLATGLAQAGSTDGLAATQQPVQAAGAAGAGGGGGGTAVSYDPADLNFDGTVTAAERVQYALKQYEKQKEAAS